MKKSVVGLILLALLLQTCRDDDPVNTGNVQFSFSASSLGNPGGRSLSDLADGSVLFISISKSNGDPVHTLKELTLLKLGDQFVSSPLAIPNGNYEITDFLVANADHDVLYATPKEGSPLATLVEHPLPIAFGVSENEVTNLAVEVVSVDAHTPEELGYVSFAITVLPDEVFKLSVFTNANGSLELIGAHAYILHGNDTIYSKYLSPAVNHIMVDANLVDSYTLVLIEPSYKKYSRTFTINELNEELNENPLTVVLPPAVTLTTQLGENYLLFDFYLYPESESPMAATLNVDWGDGVSEEIPYNFNDPSMKHTYSKGGTYFISVSGDLELMETLNLSYNDNIKSISLRYLPELKSLIMAALQTPSTVDISHNTKLQFLNFSLSRSLRSLDISNNPAIKDVSLVCDNDFAIDPFIHQLFQHATNYGIINGQLGLHYCSETSIEWLFIGPPSPESLEELRSLRDNYGWTISPEEYQF